MVTRNPAIKSITDLGPKDKIALPGVKITGHALSLEKAAANQWGFESFDRLDPLTITLSHPDAMAALIGGMSEIDCHLASSPFYYYELARPEMHVVMKSYDVWGGKHTNGVLLATKKFHDANPGICAAVLAAQQEANAFIKAQPRETAGIYLAMTGDKQAGVEELTKWVQDPDVEYTTQPMLVMAFVEFMYKVGRLKKKPAGLGDLFFAEGQGAGGS